MEMDDGFLSFHDLDWFACLEDGNVAHFATGGQGAVPLKVRSSISGYETVYEYFNSLPHKFDAEVIGMRSPLFADESQRKYFFSSFVSMAGKGLFSFDVDLDGDVGDGRDYVLMARPDVGIQCSDLPDHIREVICLLPVGVSQCISKEAVLKGK
ncbi:hypothetical protein [Pseudomonas asplenii]|uniref:hypothetical protein n=1 Tax=Pseudomonas asplenii TaxID=53407 RepID=UPI00128F7B4D|nr:hypothetical protein [Pseudomonas fuscovaginae]